MFPPHGRQRANTSMMLLLVRQTVARIAKFHPLLLHLLQRQCNGLKMRWNSGWISACSHKKQRIECSNMGPIEALKHSAGPFVTSKSLRSCTQQMFLNKGEIEKRSLLLYSPATGLVYCFQNKLQTPTSETTGSAHSEPSKQIMSNVMNLVKRGKSAGRLGEELVCTKLRSNTPICFPVLI